MERIELTMLEEQLLDEYERSVRICRMHELENQQLPKGSISRKYINGKVRHYLQWREGKQVKSLYIKASDVVSIEEQIEKRKNNDSNIKRLKQSRKVIEKAFGKKRLYSIIDKLALMDNAQAVSLKRMLNEEETGMTFELFKSAICQRAKSLGYREFIKQVLLSDDISHYFERKEYAEALYLLAMVDYLSNKHNIPLYNKFDNMRTMKLANIVYPRDIELLALLNKNDKVKKDAWESAIPEFKRHNIVENEVENVC